MVLFTVSSRILPVILLLCFIKWTKVQQRRVYITYFPTFPQITEAVYLRVLSEVHEKPGHSAKTFKEVWLVSSAS